MLVEIQQRLKFLNDVGLEYLTLDRLSATLSGGEAQRIQLATCLGSRLVGACYVLDEPSIGLHSRDTGRLIGILKELRDLGNTILVVEHDPEVMRSADHIVDLGPGAGENGGRITFEGSYGNLMQNGNGSLTSRYLRGELKTSNLVQRRTPNPRRVVRFIGAQAHNLKNIDVAIPLNLMVAVTGVSGSGKSTLVHDVIYQSLSKRMNRETSDGAGGRVGRRAREAILPQGGKGGSADAGDSGGSVAHRANAALQSGHLYQGVRYHPGPVRFHSGSRSPGLHRRALFLQCPGGRCETCQGDGTVTVEMQFLADVELVCEDCKGMRYKQSVLDVRYRGLNIHEVLGLTVKEALTFFVRHSPAGAEAESPE